MDQTDSDAAFDRYVVPESRRVPQSILTKQGKIQFKKAHAPLLFLTGENDNLIPLALVKRNVKAYRKSEGVVDFQAFKNRSHFICNQDGWEEIADKGFTWLSSQ
jgi:predicted esterase